MGEKLVKKLALPYIRAMIIVVVCLIAVIGWFDWRFGAGALALGGALLIFCLIVRYRQRKWVEDYLAHIENEIDETLRYAVRHHPLPICIAEESGRVVMANGNFREIYPDTQVMKTEIFQLTGRNHRDFLPEEQDRPIHLTVNGKMYKILSSYLDGDVSKSVLLYYIDVTGYESLKVRYNEERPCIAHILVDNYDELIASSPDEKKSLIAANIETTIRQWAGKINAAVTKYAVNRYFIVFEYKEYEKLAEGKFVILDEIRQIETDADFPVTLSIGIGVGGKLPLETDEFAAFALDLALGRGGDQAVVKRSSKVDYYGGKLQIIERRNKGKSRVMAHAIRQLIDQSSRVLIMGHKNPDMDSLGAAIGVARIAMNRGKSAGIVINEVNHSMEDVFQAALNAEEYTFVKTDAALELVDRETLLVVVDTNRPGITEAPELLGRTEKTVVIDHHRKTEEFIENATLTYMEPGASSTSELITEILQYMSDKKKPTRLEAEMLLAGIIVDTNSFSVKTGARTFEAASWLRMNGADTSVIRQLLQNDMEDFRQRASIISNAEFLKNGIAISRSEGRHANAQIINAQAADELLDIKGIRASFVVGETDTEVVVSARSLGDVNVQTIMEKLGGGGHLTMAAAQITGRSVDETTEQLKEIIEEALK